MPEGIWIALITAGAALVGYLLRPVGDAVGLALADRRARTAERRANLAAVQSVGADLVKYAEEYMDGGPTHEDGMVTLGRLGVLAANVEDKDLRELIQATRSAGDAALDQRGSFVPERKAALRAANEAMTLQAGELLRR